MDHARKCHADLDLICEDIRKIQVRCGHEVVRLPARRLRPSTASNATSWRPQTAFTTRFMLNVGSEIEKRIASIAN